MKPQENRNVRLEKVRGCLLRFAGASFFWAAGPHTRSFRFALLSLRDLELVFHPARFFFISFSIMCGSSLPEWPFWLPLRLPNKSGISVNGISGL
jgi:hypothetical protein